MNDEIDIKLNATIEIAKLSLRPGDVLLAQYDGRLSRETADRIKAYLETVLSPHTKCLVVGSEFDFSVISSEGETAPAIFKALASQK